MVIGSAPLGSSGIFIKTPSPHIIEVLATCPELDFGILDGEHAPFDRGDLDVMLLAGKAAGLPLLVRVQDTQPSTLLSALDLGAQGLVIPHVDTPQIAAHVAKLARYRGGLRGYSGGTRIAGYGTIRMAEVCNLADVTPIIAQIEHPSAVESVCDILAVEGIAGILVGRADLALSMGFDDTAAPEVEEAASKMFASIKNDGKIVGVVVGDRAEGQRFAAMGANWFVIGTDHSLLRAGVRAALKR
jgi:2-keto-3-deoxy-L-rhamnonate aldolase RhmA